jgi:glycosyltransferase involved in cell wall biosynthesis
VSDASVHLDLSELVMRPLRSGIQRVEREAIRHWPGPAPLIPCMIGSGGRVIQLSPKVLDVLCAEDDGNPSSRDAELAALQSLVAAGESIADQSVDRLLNLELFYNPSRADAHLRLAASGARVLWYLYDFLPYLRPELFPAGTARHCMDYLRALRGIGGRLAFLSRATRSDYVARIAHGRPASGDLPVIDPGADGLRLERQVFTPERRDFIAIGTVELRKNPGALLRAFEHLWDEGVPARLVVAGRLSPDAAEVRAFFARHADNPHLTVLEQPSDETLRQYLRRARAVVMPSEAEGFGLPPYEALHAGIPAIASASLPSAALMTAGALLLDRMDAAAIAGAVKRLIDDAEATRLWSAAGTLTLPRWADFGRRLGDWAQAA